MLSKKTETKNVQSHIDKAYEFIDIYLPGNYVELVLEKFPNGEVSKREIHGVRNRINVKNNPKLKVLNAIVEVAKEHKKELEKLQKQTA